MRFADVRRFLEELVHGYGSFLFFTRPSANLLLVACTMLQPWVGSCGLLAGASTLLCRRWLGLTTVAGGLEVVNGILAGLLIALLFAPEWRTLALVLCAGPFALLVSAWLGDALKRQGLPLLSGSFVIVGSGLLAVGRAIALPYATPPVDTAVVWLPVPIHEFLRSLGGAYLTRSAAGGALVLIALMVSSRTLVLLAILAGLLSEAILVAIGIPLAGLSAGAAITAAIMAAIMTGGLFTTPGARATAVAMFAAAIATVASVSLFNMLWFMWLPSLSLPYLAATWMVMYALRPERGAAWARYWHAPHLPERHMDRLRQREARGLSAKSVALRAPFYGRWDVYQGFDGHHTHQRPRQHALDFHRLVAGRSHRGEGQSNDDFHCFGLPVRSPAWGTVVACRSDLPDNPPGEVDLVNCWGNFVLIAIATGDYVLIAHLRQGSVTVVYGEYVAPGRHIGQCGSSGRSPQPHIHMHVQTAFDLGSPTRPFHLAGACISTGGITRYALDGIPREHDRVEVHAVSPTLRRGLHWPVGTRLTYAVNGPGGAVIRRVLEVGLTPANHFRLYAETGAQVLFEEADDLLAFYERGGPPDLLVDAIALAAGLTPLIDAECEWNDAPAPALLPLARGLRAIRWLVPALVEADSRYRREWDAATLTWRQSGTHRLIVAGRPAWECMTTATLVEGQGLRAITLAIGRDTVIEAALIGIGCRKDTGIDAWEKPIGDVA